MIKTYGIYNLGKVLSESKTKSGDSFVMFSAASKRGENTDWVTFKAFGRVADYFLRGMVKNNDGKYRSRKMIIEGVLETSEQDRPIELTTEISPSHIPEQLGYLRNDIKIRVKTLEKMKDFAVIISSLDFLDNKKENEIEVVLNESISTEDYKEALSYTEDPITPSAFTESMNGLANIKSVDDLE